MATTTDPITTPAPAEPWTIDSARALYNIEGWGAGFFDISERGTVVVRPDRAHPERELDLLDLARDLEEQGVALPVLLRFSDILRSRIEQLSQRFRAAIKEFEYGGGYTTVYPIKVNQQRHVVEEIVEYGQPYGVGLECGSKPELQAVLALSESTEHIIVCNGYKDHEFMRLALMGQKVGHTVFIVIEQLSEVDVLLEVADELGVTPTCGVRIKLATESAGRWAQSAGEKSKFGLNAVQIVKLIDRLRDAGRLDIIKLLHFHLGSQIPDIRFIKAGLQEIARFYVEMRHIGVDVTHVDVGGGLGVDYDGTASSSSNASVNYTLQEYANDIVYTMAEACRENEVPMPHLISESGRALTAHHALLLLRVIDVESQAEPPLPTITDDDHALLHEMVEDYELLKRGRLTPRKVLEVYHDASFDKDRARQLFNSGVLDLRGLAAAEQIYFAQMNMISRVVNGDRDEYEEILKELDATLVDRYFCNFSLFQSLPDNWAIDQLFPIMPVHRLDEEPTRRGTLQDVTCDSDGKIDRFVGDKTGRPSLELHEFRDGEDYVLGIFLTGAYQEILGDLHNLFGDTNAVHVKFTERGYDITDLVHGDTVTEVLNYVQFHAATLLTTWRRKVGSAKGLSRQEANAFVADYVAGLEGYTYLEGEAAR
ncbi:Biosynthetic arginine decarboxylase [Gemmatirosa kalamazoonensis]|uniref:Biosynthetic arginine decarboxylase n=1 Tax=Gemmatirosa kalamazoonensis TaxID=861299 RepID=W0RJD6_9BACT|nr:biosynthetic arginine decarboxylase [Gemmatirosa kalamazoonensis]AHG91184.1 Biosynthetic arginine decarboxylase [Gemmatirosa kalamazoonensis]